MKNLKMGAKIFIAFGIVIVFMLLSVLFVFISNMQIINNVDTISKDSDLQTTGNALKDDFLLTRIEAVRLLSTTDAIAFTNFSKQADLVLQDYSDIYRIISKDHLLDEFRPAFEQAEVDFKAYLTKANELGEANQAEEEQIVKMIAAGEILGSICGLIFDDQLQLLKEEIYDETVEIDAQIRRAERLQMGVDIEENIYLFRIYAREMMANFDTTNMPIALQYLDNAYELTEGYNKASTMAKNIENSALMMEAITEYRNALVDFGAICDHAANVSTEIGPLGLTALNSLSDAVGLLDVAMVAQVDNTKVAASGTFVLVLCISLLSVLVAVALAVVIMKSITTPVKKMMLAADALALGDMDVDMHYESRDEIGHLSASFEKMLVGIKEQVNVVEGLSSGDLSVSINPRSDKDTMGFSLKKMVDNLNDMFIEINGASDQVSMGSKQIADGAQLLAQGSTEQASTVEELSASISHVAEKTKDNADMAAKAAELAKSIKQNAEKGSSQMTGMMEAVKEINNASQSISKVIKVIDDIAFQTNILALNAAVEAARAGQHGKGFAVVAEEVRSLAAKSAEAARDTGELIANSIEKAEYGSHIAQETAESLAEIVSGINESTRIVTDIARISEEQSASVLQINIGIGQVTQVVQQNSATAQQSAAASEEMNIQSEMLRERISQFKLRSTNASSTPLIGARAAGNELEVLHGKGENRSIDEDGYGKY